MYVVLIKSRELIAAFACSLVRIDGHADGEPDEHAEDPDAEARDEASRVTFALSRLHVVELAAPVVALH